MNKIPKGKLLIIGGAEDKGDDVSERPGIKDRNKEFKPYEILGELVPPEPRKAHSIEIITTASEIPEDVEKMYMRAFKNTGFTNVGTMRIENKEEARNKTFIERIQKAHAVLFSGGDQFKLSTILGGTEILEAIKTKYIEDKHFIVAGTSAGAMVMPDLMIIRGEVNEAMLKGDLKIGSGFGIMSHVFVDTHFIKRGRFGRLAHAVIMNPSCIGLGLGEDTALIIKRGNEAECKGSGMVIIIDGKKIGDTNISYAEDDTPLFVENLKVHILTKGGKFLLEQRKYVPSKQAAEKNE